MLERFRQEAEAALLGLHPHPNCRCEIIIDAVASPRGGKALVMTGASRRLPRPGEERAEIVP